MQTAHIYYLDWKRNPDLVRQIQFKEYVPTFEEFNECYEKVGADDVSDNTEDAFKHIWGSWQAGMNEIKDGVESTAFHDAEVRSMCVGDVIMLDHSAHIVKPVGFEEVPF